MPKLSDPIRIGQVEIKNRCFAAPFLANWGTYWGEVTEHLLESYEKRAKGGFGLVCVEATTIDPRTSQFCHMLQLSHNKHISDFSMLAQVVHRWGAKIVVQLQHGGSRSNPDLCDQALWGDCTPLGPSADGPDFLGGAFREITPEEIEEIISKFVKSVTIAKSAGLDGVLFHLTHGFLPHQFLSPWMNKRTDKWGIQDGKFLFCTEIIRRSREAVGPSFILGARIPGEDNLDTITATVNPKAKDAKNYLTLDMMAKKIAPQLVEAGLDYLDVTTGQLEAAHQLIPFLYYPRGYLVRYAEEVKKNVSVPVVGGGKMLDHLLAEKLVEGGRIDAVFFGRQSIADPELPNKTFTGKTKDIKRCICCDSCTLDLYRQWEVKCAINPDIGPFQFRPLKRVSKPKNVLVIGGGVGGMEAARLADLGGHKVTLMEKRNELGGMVNGVSKLPRLYTRDLRNIVDWENHQLSKSSVKVELNREATLDMVKKMKPDAVILATGACFDASGIKGGNQEIVTTLDAYLMGEARIGGRVVIIGGALGAEPALSLAREGKVVTVLEEEPPRLDGVIFTSGVASGPWMYLYRTLYILEELGKEKTITLWQEVKVKEITSKGVIFSDKDGKEYTVETDNVIIATGHRPNNTLPIEDLRKIVPEVYEIGDCVKPGRISDAFHSANQFVRDMLSNEFD